MHTTVLCCHNQQLEMYKVRNVFVLPLTNIDVTILYQVRNVYHYTNKLLNYSKITIHTCTCTSKITTKGFDGDVPLPLSYGVYISQLVRGSVTVVTF